VTARPPACAQSGLLVLDESPPHIELLLPESCIQSTIPPSYNNPTLFVTIFRVRRLLNQRTARSSPTTRGVPSSRLLQTSRPNGLKSLRLRFGRESNTASPLSREPLPPPFNIALFLEAPCCFIAQIHRARICRVFSEESATKNFPPSFVAKIQLPFLANLCRTRSPSISKRLQQVP
jgi:hypothetical protein